MLKTPPVCTDHSLDGFTAIGQFAFGANYNTCSWAKRIVIPLKFAPTPENCPPRKVAFRAAGPPMLPGP